MKNSINVGDKVAVLDEAHVVPGVCTKINGKSYKVKYHCRPAGRVLEKNFKKERVAHADDVVTMVCDYRRSPNGSCCRFEYELYPGERRKATAWREPFEFVSEN